MLESRGVAFLVRSSIVGVAVGLAVFVACWGLTWASLAASGERSTAAIRSAFEQRELRPDAIWRLGDTDIGAHQFNDCLVLGQALDVRAPSRMLAVSPLSGVEAEGGPCRQLSQLVGPAPPAPGKFYHHYVHAGTALARWLLPSLGVSGLRDLYRLAESLILLAGIAYAMLGLARGRRPGLDAAWLVIFVAFGRWFGLETFGQSIAHAPADLVALGFLLWLSRASASRPLSHRAAILGAAVFGGLTMAFELLTGGVPLGLAIVVGALPLALCPDDRTGATVIGGGVAFCAAAVACLVAKILAVVLVWGWGPIVVASQELQFLLGARAVDLSGGNPRAGVGEYVLRVWAGLDSLAPGLIWLTTGTLLLAVAGGLWAVKRRRRDGSPTARGQVTWLMGSNLVLVAWLLLLWQHTAVHAWFMDRILVWTIASGGAAFALTAAREPIAGAEA